MIILNYKPVLRQPTGIGVYANAILPAFDQFEHILIPGGGSGGMKERLQRLTWSQFQLPILAAKRKADLIFTPAPEGYLGKQTVQQVVMVHDLRPLTHPERSIQSLYFQNWVPILLKQCKHILVNSKFTAMEICMATGVTEDKISVTPLGYDADHFYPSKVIHKLHSRPYLLHVGQAYPHKNLQRLIQAFSSIASNYSDLDLVLLGKPHPTESIKLQQLAAELDLSERVIFKRYASYEDLPNWYRGAVAFVYPSLWEGFGLPILEAMACGCPVVTSYGSAMEEIAGKHARLVNPTDLNSIAFQIRSVIDDSMKRSPCSLSRTDIQHLSQFSWSQTIHSTASHITKILSS